MIFFLTTKRHDYTIRKCLRTEGRELTSQVQPLCYGRLFLRRHFTPGTYIFSDLERLSESDLVRAQHVWDCLARDPRCRLLNHPQRTWRRFQLLRTLHEQDINQFNVYRLADDPRPARFPVFIRGENDHKGPQSELLYSQDELDSARIRLIRARGTCDGTIVTEFCDVADTNSVYRKYSAFRIGERLLPRHLFFSKSWSVKSWELLDHELLEEERRYVDENPHREELNAIFDLAHIDFGRVDYGIVDGNVQVWEINTNPMLPVDYGGGGPLREALHQSFNRRFIDAMRAIDGKRGDDTEFIAADRAAVPWWGAVGIPYRSLMRRLPGRVRNRAA